MVSPAFATTYPSWQQPALVKYRRQLWDSMQCQYQTQCLKKKKKKKKKISTAQKKGLKNYLNPGGPQRLCCLYTQSYDVLQKGDLRGTVELEPRDLTEVELGWKLLLAAFHSHVRRTVDMSKDTLFFFRFFFGDAFEQIQTQMQMQTI